MYCPKCGEKLIIMDSRRAETEVKRRRKCKPCKILVDTTEVILRIRKAKK